MALTGRPYGWLLRRPPRPTRSSPDQAPQETICPGRSLLSTPRGRVCRRLPARIPTRSPAGSTRRPARSHRRHNPASISRRPQAEQHRGRSTRGGSTDRPMSQPRQRRGTPGQVRRHQRRCLPAPPRQSSRRRPRYRPDRRQTGAAFPPGSYRGLPRQTRLLRRLPRSPPAEQPADPPTSPPRSPNSTTPHRSRR